MTSPSHHLQAELEQQLRSNLELRAALDDCRLAAASPLPLAAWQLPLLQLALALDSSAAAPSPEALQLPPAATPAGWKARLQLAWVQLGQGHAEAAAALQAELQAQLGAVEGAAVEGVTNAPLAVGLDLLNRVLSSQAWLAENATPPSAKHSTLLSAGLRMALDELTLTPGGQALCIKGWCIDPASQLAALVLLRGRQALPLPLAALQRSPRPDLGPLLEQQGLSDRWPAGFRLALPLPPGAEAGALPVLFVLLHNGEQFCLTRPAHPSPMSWSDLLALSPPWPSP